LASELLARLNPPVDNQRPFHSIVNQWGSLFLVYYDAQIPEAWRPPLGVQLAWDGFREDSQRGFTLRYHILGLDAWLSISTVGAEIRPDPDYAEEIALINLDTPPEHIIDGCNTDEVFERFEQLVRYVDGGMATRESWVLPAFIHPTEADET